jgi:hypothetical protein
MYYPSVQTVRDEKMTSTRMPDTDVNNPHQTHQDIRRERDERKHASQTSGPEQSDKPLTRSGSQQSFQKQVDTDLKEADPAEVSTNVKS